MQCRFCNETLGHVFIDLVNSPPSNSFLTPAKLNEAEAYYPLKVFTCHKCFLVQIDEYKKSNDIFNNEYVYFSSYSTTWLKHAKNYADKMIARFGYNPDSKVIEVASNDGYLLQYFKEANVPVLGIEPTVNTAEIAIDKGIECVTEFFGIALATSLAEKDVYADLLVGNNVLAHVPDIVDFVGGIKIILKFSGVVTMEFPHLMQLVDNNQFDTIYHEHFSYLSFGTVRKIFQSQGLELFDVEEIPTHGGSLRIYAKHAENSSLPILPSVSALLAKEAAKGMEQLDYYDNFQHKALKVKLDMLGFLVEEKKNGTKIAAYGAAAKGNTFLNYCGIKNELIDFVVDLNVHKQGMYLPGSHIPVVNEEYFKQQQPEYVIIFPWNLKDEIIEQLKYVRSWGGKFVIAIPQFQIF